MQKVTLIDQLGNIKHKRVGFSFLYFIFGPIYSLFRLKIILALFECLLIFYLLPVPGMEMIASLTNNITFLDATTIGYIQKALLLFRDHFTMPFGIILYFIFHINQAWLIESKKLKKFMRNTDFLPAQEKDARILIKHHVVNEKIALASSIDLRNTSSYKEIEKDWKEENAGKKQKSVTPSIENRSDNVGSNDQKFKAQIEQLKNLLSLELISQEEYDEKYRQITGGDSE